MADDVIGRMCDAYWQPVKEWHHSRDGVYQPPQATNGKARAAMRRAVEALRTPDMQACLEISRETGIPAAHIDMAWVRMIDKLLEGK